MDLILGAGIVGVSTALHLQARGRNVALLDKNGVGNEASFGNAGLIERTDLLPRTFPRDISEILRYASNSDPRLRYDLANIIALAPWLMRYWHNSNANNVRAIARNISPLFVKCLDEHHELAKLANISKMIKPDGWLQLSRDGATYKNAMIGVERAKRAGMKANVLDSAQIAKKEPALNEKFAFAIHWQDSASISDPSTYVKKLYDLFVANGGAMINGDARNLQQAENGWQLQADIGNIFADNVVVALGAWSGDIFKRFGYKIPYAVKRGYHMNYDYKKNGRLKIPIVDMDNGFVLAPMKNGTRLSSAIELAHRDKKPTPHQLKKIEPIAQSMLNLGECQIDKPWLGSRPCTADMMPVIGRAPNHKGLWFNFGHAHHGLTLGPISGKILAQIMVDEEPIVSPRAFSPARFV